MDPHDDSALRSAIATSELSCRGCSAPFVPSGLEEASRRTCTACLSEHIEDWRGSGANVAAEPGGAVGVAQGTAELQPARAPRLPRAFTPSDKSLIAKVHGYMPARQLLQMLNERMWADIGPDAPPYTVQQLQLVIQGLQHAQAPAGWSSVRRQLADARHAGVLQQVNDQLIDDFAIVYSLSPKQVLHLKDVLISDNPR